MFGSVQAVRTDPTIQADFTSHDLGLPKGSLTYSTVTV